MAIVGEATRAGDRPAAGSATAPLVVFAGGGTGGHLYPALAVADALREVCPGVRFVFFGTRRPVDRDVLGEAGEELVPQQVRPLTARPWRWPAFLQAWRHSLSDCARYFAVHRPAVVIGSGGFASGPPIYHASRQGIPTVLLNPDLVPGRANRFLARRVDVVFAQWSGSQRYLPSGIDVRAAGCPIRRAFGLADRLAGLRRFGLDPQCRTLLVTGASQGARSINEALAELAPALGGVSGWQVLHLTGLADLQRVEQAYEQARVRARCLAYTHAMADAMAGADLVVSRAGASTLAEITALGKPAVLLPYPFHRDRHQLRNAEVLAAAGAARICVDAGVGGRTAAELHRALAPLLTNEDELAVMGTQSRRLGRPGAALVIAREVLELSGRKLSERGDSAMQKSPRVGR